MLTGAIQNSPTVRRIVGPTMLLRSGVYLDLLEPEACEFTIDDVAHGLSMVCRFGGQCERFYSVAEHCVHASHHVAPAHALAALLHDAPEAFIGDIIKPLKDILPDYRRLEVNVERAVMGRLNVALPLPAEVKEVDVVLLATEQRQIMRNRDDWNYTRGRKPLPIVLPCWSPSEAKAAFLRRFDEISGL